MGKKNRRDYRNHPREPRPNLALVNNSPGYSPERLAMNIAMMRQRATATVEKRAALSGRQITDKLGPKGAGQFIRDAILSGRIPPTWHPPESPNEIAWLESADWWDKILNAAKRIGIEIL